MIVNLRFHGGHIEDSPSGKYSLSIWAPMDPAVAGTYSIMLRENKTGRTLRSATVKLNSKEKTKSLRGLPVSMTWDSLETYADIGVDGDFLMRISVPVTGQ